MEISLNQIGFALLGLTAVNGALILYLMNQLKGVKEHQQQLRQQTETQLDQSATEQASLLTKCFTRLQNQTASALEEIRTRVASLEAGAEERHAKMTQALVTVASEEKSRTNALTEQLQQSLDRMPGQIKPLLEGETDKLQRSLSQGASAAEQANAETVRKMAELAGEQRFVTRRSQQAQLEQLSSLVQSLKIGNAVELTNALMEGRDLKVETEEFVKHLGECKVTAMEDKLSGQVTEILYEQGRKVASRTFEQGRLKYQISFDERGQAIKGEEFNDDGELTFEYQYDLAGEVSDRREPATQH